jgi:hypothetical protein
VDQVNGAAPLPGVFAARVADQQRRWQQAAAPVEVALIASLSRPSVWSVATLAGFSRGRSRQNFRFRNRSRSSCFSIFKTAKALGLAAQSRCRAAAHWQPLTKETMTSARDYFERAIKLDPQNAEALVGLAYARLRAYYYGWSTAAEDKPFPLWLRAYGQAHARCR